jgi:hypothetical protein
MEGGAMAAIILRNVMQDAGSFCRIRKART